MFEYPGESAGDFRESAVAIRNSDGNISTDFRYVSHKIYQGKPSIEGMPALWVNDESDADTLEILTEDSVTGIQAVLIYTVFNNYGAMTRSVRIVNASSDAAEIEKVASCCVDFNTCDFDMISLVKIDYSFCFDLNCVIRFTGIYFDSNFI